MNPNGTVPAIEDGGCVLWESNAIVTYLGLRYGLGTLVDGASRPSGAPFSGCRGPTSTSEPHLHTLVMQLSRLREDLRTPGAIEAAVRGITPALGILDAHLAHNAYLAGDCFSMGDIPAAAAARRWQVFAQAGPAIPHVDAWLARLAEREGFRRHIAPPELHI